MEKFTFEEVFDSAKLSRYVGITEVTVESIPSETTKINFEYTKKCRESYF